jgi:hypothetical protein
MTPPAPCCLHVSAELLLVCCGCGDVLTLEQFLARTPRACPLPREQEHAS